MTPVFFDGDENKPVIDVCRDALNELRELGYLKSGDLVLFTHGDKIETTGSTNTCKILTVE